MTEKLVVQKSIASDTGLVRITMVECAQTGDLTVRFGASYTLRAPAGELAALLLELSVVANAAAGGIIDVD
jgi:hypothetical protein